MNLVNEAKLFVETLRNDRYLYEDGILLGIRKRRTFYGISEKMDHLFRYNIIKKGFIIVYPFILLLYVIIELFRLSIKIVTARKHSLIYKSYFIAATPFSKSINHRINKFIADACWILNCNNSPKDYEINSKKYVTCYQLVTVSDAFNAALETLISYVLICKQYGFFYMLDSINAFYWFIYNRACKQIPIDSSIFFHVHKDRWAFLIDKINCKEKILIQHGSEISNCSTIIADKRKIVEIPGGYTQKVPNKYSSLTRVIALAECEIPALQHSIVGCNPEYVIGGYGFETYSLNSNIYSILIIAHSGIYFDKEVEIIKSLQDLPVDIYVKNHPTQRNEMYINLLNTLNFKLVREQKFPRVNIVVTYDSTLAHEYSSIGVQVIYHTQHSIEEIRNRIICQL